MKKNTILIGIASTIVIVSVLYLVKKNRMEKKLLSVADAGYETAHDVLFPLKRRRWKKY